VRYTHPVQYLGIDLGDKRTGLALGDGESGIASPLMGLEIPVAADKGRALIEAIASVAEEHRPGAVVVGLPLNMEDGSEGPAALRARAFAQRLAERLALPVLCYDERLSSSEADWSMARSGLTRGQKKARRDALAAAVILGDFLASLRPPNRAAGDDQADEDQSEEDESSLADGSDR